MKWHIAILFAFLAIACLPLSFALEAPNSSIVYRVNAGGPAFIDQYGNQWYSDSGSYSNSTTYTQNVPIRRTDVQQVYQSERLAQSGSKQLSYKFLVQDGEYEVVMHFAQIRSSDLAQKTRRFDVKAEGQTVIKDLDVYGEAGLRTALIKQFTVRVTDGTLNLDLVRKVADPKVSGIEIFRIDKNSHPSVGLSTVDIGFEPTLVGNQSPPHRVTIRNVGTRTLHISEVKIIGIDANDFLSQSRSTSTLPPDAGVSFDLYFAPKIKGRAEASLIILSDDPESPHVINMVAQTPDAVNGSRSKQGLIVQYFDTKGGRIVIDPANATVIGGGILPQVDFRPSLFPGKTLTSERSSDVAARISGTLSIQKNGLYRFHLASDDSSRLSIDGRTIIENDGPHGMRTEEGFAGLTLGDHNITIDYAQGRLWSGLILEWTPPGGKRSLIPNASLSYTAQQLPPIITAVRASYERYSFSNPIVIEGFGFAHPRSQVAILLGNATVRSFKIVNDSLLVAEGLKENASVPVTVLTLNGRSNIFAYSPGRLPSIHLRVNAGNTSFTDASGNVWSDDYGFSGGRRFYLTLPVSGTENVHLYESFRQGEGALNYTFALPTGEYDVITHFAEISPLNSKKGARVFSVLANGAMKVENLDVFSEAGADAAITRTFPVMLANGNLTLSFVPSKGSPMVAGIEVISR